MTRNSALLSFEFKVPAMITDFSQIESHQKTVDQMQQALFNFHLQSSAFQIAALFKDFPDLESFTIQRQSISDYEGGHMNLCFSKEVTFSKRMEEQHNQAPRDGRDDEKQATKIDEKLRLIHDSVASTLNDLSFKRAPETDQLEAVISLILPESDYLTWRELSGIKTPMMSPAPQEEPFNMKEFFKKLESGEVQHFGVPKPHP